MLDPFSKNLITSAPTVHTINFAPYLCKNFASFFSWKRGAEQALPFSLGI
jgi:hypothetical protein